MTGISHRLCTVFAVLAAVTLAAGCIAFPFGAVGNGTVSATGTVTYFNCEGGFYGLTTEDRERYFPVNLPDDLAAGKSPA